MEQSDKETTSVIICEDRNFCQDDKGNKYPVMGIKIMRRDKSSSFYPFGTPFCHAAAPPNTVHLAYINEDGNATIVWLWIKPKQKP